MKSQIRNYADLRKWVKENVRLEADETVDDVVKWFWAYHFEAEMIRDMTMREMAMLIIKGQTPLSRKDINNGISILLEDDECYDLTQDLVRFFRDGLKRP